MATSLRTQLCSIPTHCLYDNVVMTRHEKNCQKHEPKSKFNLELCWYNEYHVCFRFGF